MVKCSYKGCENDVRYLVIKKVRRVIRHYKDGKLVSRDIIIELDSKVKPHGYCYVHRELAHYGEWIDLKKIREKYNKIIFVGNKVDLKDLGLIGGDD